jgi:hypothetical protein
MWNTWPANAVAGNDQVNRLVVEAVSEAAIMASSGCDQLAPAGGRAQRRPEYGVCGAARAPPTTLRCRRLPTGIRVKQRDHRLLEVNA